MIFILQHRAEEVFFHMFGGTLSNSEYRMKLLGIFQKLHPQLANIRDVLFLRFNNPEHGKILSEELLSVSVFERRLNGSGFLLRTRSLPIQPGLRSCSVTEVVILILMRMNADQSSSCLRESAPVGANQRFLPKLLNLHWISWASIRQTEKFRSRRVGELRNRG